MDAEHKIFIENMAESFVRAYKKPDELDLIIAVIESDVASMDFSGLTSEERQKWYEHLEKALDIHETIGEPRVRMLNAIAGIKD